MSNNELLIERYELKYRIPPPLVVPIRQSIQKYCRPDSASGSGPYLISSLYLDSPDRVLYQDTKEAEAKRFKLRIRRYSTGPYFIECKRREKDVISKARTAIPGSAWPMVLTRPRGANAIEGEKNRRNLADFIERMHRINAEPACVVRYRREAWVSRIDDYGRVTFDYGLCGHAPIGWDVPIDGPGWVPLDQPGRFGLAESGVVLELKCTTQVPLWMSDLVRRFGLVRQGFSKYCAALEGTYQDSLPRFVPAEPARFAFRSRP